MSEMRDRPVGDLSLEEMQGAKRLVSNLEAFTKSTGFAKLSQDNQDQILSSLKEISDSMNSLIRDQLANLRQYNEAVLQTYMNETHADEQNGYLTVGGLIKDLFGGLFKKEK